MFVDGLSKFFLKGPLDVPTKGFRKCSRAFEGALVLSKALKNDFRGMGDVWGWFYERYFAPKGGWAIFYEGMFSQNFTVVQ